MAYMSVTYLCEEKISKCAKQIPFMINNKKIGMLSEMDELKFKLARRFREVLRLKWRSDKIFLLETGYEEKAFCRFKEMDNNPTFTTICKMAKALGVQPADLLKFDLTTKIELLAKSPYYKEHKPINSKHGN